MKELEGAKEQQINSQKTTQVNQVTATAAKETRTAPEYSETKGET